MTISTSGRRYPWQMRSSTGSPRFLSIHHIRFLFQGVNVCMVISVMWYGGHLVLQGKMASDLLLSFLIYQMRTSDNLVQMSDVFDGLMKTIGASRKVFLVHIMNERFPGVRTY